MGNITLCSNYENDTKSPSLFIGKMLEVPLIELTGALAEDQSCL